MSEVSVEYPSHLPTAAVMAEAARRCCALPEGDREDCVATLFKLIDAVIATPTEAKKRRVKKANATIHQKVARHSCALEFLRSVGFLDGDDPEAGADGRGALLEMPVAFIVRLTDGHHSLASAATQASLPVPPLPACPVFNPYASSSTALNSTSQPKVPQSFKNETERVERELREREAALKAKVECAPPVPLNPSVFWAAAGRRLEEIVKETAAIGEEEKGDNNIIGDSLSNVKAAINGTNLKFESANKRALTQLSSKKVHEFCILRVTCPDKSVLQVHFRARDKGDHVLSQIGPLLAPHVRSASWYLYQSPPLKRLETKETLVQAGFPPGANLYLGFDGEKASAPFFEPSLQAKLGPAPQDHGRGVNGVANPFSGEAMGWGQGQKLGSAPAAASTATAPTAAPGTSPSAAPAATQIYGGQGNRLGGGEFSQPMDVDEMSSRTA